jgi:glycosyltransferase involved in cell wall biosynthesis
MRIVMLTDFYHPFVGGVEQHVRSLSAELVARGHEVAVATLRHGSAAACDSDGGVRVHRIRSTTQRATWLFSHPQRSWAPPFPDPEISWRLWHVLAAERPDIVHGHDWLARSFIPMQARSSAKFVMSLHYYTLSCAKKSLMHLNVPCDGPRFSKCLTCAIGHYGLAKGIPTVLGNWAMSAAERAVVDMFLPVSQATAVGNGLVSQGLPYQVIPNFIPDVANLPGGDPAAYIAQLPSTGYLLFVGDLRREKGIEVLLRAYAELQNAPPLVLIGKVWAESPTQFPPNVVVFNNWPNYAVMEAWRRCLAAVVPSLWLEPFGIVVIEAMASGRPVIASRVGGMVDLVVDGETGILVAPNDVLALHGALEQMLVDVHMRERMAQAARQRARLFQANTVVPRIEQVYRDLIHQPSQAASKAASKADQLLDRRRQN